MTTQRNRRRITENNTPGPKGDAATVHVGPTTTGAPGTPAAVVNTGDEHAATLAFTVPAGQDGADSTVPGPPGPIPAHMWAGTSLSVQKPDGTQGAYVNLKGAAGDNGLNADLQVSGTVLQKRLGTGAWTNLFDLLTLKGADGRQVELGTSATHVQWRLTGDAWQNLYALSSVKGTDGTSATLSLGTVTALPAGSAPTATMTGTVQARVLNLSLPTTAPAQTLTQTSGTQQVALSLLVAGGTQDVTVTLRDTMVTPYGVVLHFPGITASLLAALTFTVTAKTATSVTVRITNTGLLSLSATFNILVTASRLA